MTTGGASPVGAPGSPRARFDLVSFLSDFGLDDTFVGVCHGVVLRIAPHVQILDLTHSVEPGDVRGGALLLARAMSYLPVGVHLAVVDPGVGTDRRGVAIRTTHGDVLVGPDNGLLAGAAEALGGMTGVWELTSPAHRLEPVSQTFHGRDVFAPAVGAIALGVDPAALGGAVAGLVDLDPLPPPVVTPERLEAQVVHVDRFGNLQLGAVREDLGVLGLHLGQCLVVSVAERRSRARYVRTFGELADGGLGLYEDSDWQLALAVRGGSAARRLEAGRGAIVNLCQPQSSARGRERTPTAQQNEREAGTAPEAEVPTGDGGAA